MTATTKRTVKKVIFRTITVILIAVAAYFAIGIVRVIYLQNRWTQFRWQLAQSVAVARDNNSLCAESDGVKVRISDENAQFVYSFLGSPAGTCSDIASDERQIYFDFGDGSTMRVTERNGFICIVYDGRNTFRFKVGRGASYSQFERVFSIEGANYPNSAW